MNVNAYRIVEFDQHLLLRTARDANLPLGRADEGICGQLCWKWLKRIHFGAVALGPAVFLRDYSSSGDLETRKTAALRRIFGFFEWSTLSKAIARRNQMIQPWLVYSLYGIPNTELTSRNGYCDLLMSSFRLRGGGGWLRFACPSLEGAVHAIAFYVFPSTQSGLRQLNPTVHVFDPNYGEFSMRCGVFLVWLPTFLSEKYGALFSDVAETQLWRP